MIPSPACSCGHRNETPAHLLKCPLYSEDAIVFLSDPIITSFGKPTKLLLGKLPKEIVDENTKKNRRLQKYILSIGRDFLQAVDEIRPLI